MFFRLAAILALISTTVQAAALPAFDGLSNSERIRRGLPARALKRQVILDGTPVALTLTQPDASVYYAAFPISNGNPYMSQDFSQATTFYRTVVTDQQDNTLRYQYAYTAGGISGYIAAIGFDTSGPYFVQSGSLTYNYNPPHTGTPQPYAFYPSTVPNLGIVGKLFYTANSSYVDFCFRQVRGSPDYPYSLQVAYGLPNAAGTPCGVMTETPL